jgi:hypothetical protein
MSSRASANRTLSPVDARTLALTGRQAQQENRNVQHVGGPYAAHGLAMGHFPVLYLDHVPLGISNILKG